MGNTRKRASAKPTEALLAHLHAFLQERIARSARLCVAYSGGLDSTVLLHALVVLRAACGFSLRALHVHHGLCAEADAWAEHCRARCVAWSVPLRIERVRVAPAGHGLEAAARAARYALYAREEADYLLLAHHLDDQVETGLLRLLRGAGAHGLAGMAPQRPSSAQTGSPILLRPFLDCPRSALLAYANAVGLDWVEDASNSDTRFSRNWLRHDLLPRLQARYPAYRATFARAMRHFAASAELLDDLAALDLAALAPQGVEQGIDLAGLRRLSPARRHNLLRYAIRCQSGLPPKEAALAELERQMLDPRTHAAPRWQTHGLEAGRFRGRLFLRPTAHETFPASPWLWHGQAELRIGQRLWMRFQRTQGEGLAASALPVWPVEFETRRGGERMCVRPEAGERSLKELLREAGIPPWQRDRLPLLRLGDTVAWMAGIGVDVRFRARPGEPGWIISCLLER